MANFIDPFIVYCPNEDGMNSNEIQKTGLAAAEVNGAIHQLFNGQATEDDVNDRLRAIGIEPAEYWNNAEESIEIALAEGEYFEDVEVLPSGLVIVR